jgi:hypothetical protein
MRFFLATRRRGHPSVGTKSLLMLPDWTWNKQLFVLGRVTTVGAVGLCNQQLPQSASPRAVPGIILYAHVFLSRPHCDLALAPSPEPWFCQLLTMGPRCPRGHGYVAFELVAKAEPMLLALPVQLGRPDKQRRDRLISGRPDHDPASPALPPMAVAPKVRIGQDGPLGLCGQETPVLVQCCCCSRRVRRCEPKEVAGLGACLRSNDVKRQRIE